MATTTAKRTPTASPRLFLFLLGVGCKEQKPARRLKKTAWLRPDSQGTDHDTLYSSKRGKKTRHDERRVYFEKKRRNPWENGENQKPETPTPLLLYTFFLVQQRKSRERGHYENKK